MQIIIQVDDTERSAQLQAALRAWGCEMQAARAGTARPQVQRAPEPSPETAQYYATHIYPRWATSPTTLTRYYVTLIVEGATRWPIIMDMLSDYGFDADERREPSGALSLIAREMLALPAQRSLAAYTDDLAASLWRANQGPCTLRVEAVSLDYPLELVRDATAYDQYAASHVLPFQWSAEDDTH